ncbi:MAG: RNA-binding transcriptional accessory protein [Bacilli bacterium]|nr:RNA-binding transcriptional accessory protein [Bacilli bacterium]
MNDAIIEQIASEEKITKKQVEVVLQLLKEGNTIPFIARYRKEMTNALDEEQIRKISDVYQYQLNLYNRKEDVIRLIDEKGLLTEELKAEILKCNKLVEVEDLYRPYKEKKKTKATEAIKNGLEPLAKKIMSFPVDGNIENLVKPYINENVKDIESAVEGASYIIAEWISDNASFRKFIRSYIYKNSSLVTKKKKNELDKDLVYEMYYDYQENIRSIKAHRVMAVNRAEKEGVISVSINYDKEGIISFLTKRLVKNEKSFVVEIVKNSILDSLKRLILPSVEREVRTELKEKAEVVSIDNFSNNVEKLLLTPPMKEKVVLGYDPAFRTGCKLAVLDPTGKPLEIAVIYPTEPHLKIEESKKKVLELIDKYGIDIIAIGNGTASRESEAFIASVIKEAKRHVDYIIVNEAGASVYSASKLAISEFPDLTVEKRSAISIGRRLQDSLSELVKIDPKSIGVGLYQHDVSEKKLDESLTFVVEKTVNSVGVNINTASRSLLSYVSGLTKKAIDEILKVRDQFGKFVSREQVRKLKSMTPKVYEQSIGFIRILDGENPFDKTSIHPESYDAATKLLNILGFSPSDIGSVELKDALNLDLEEYSKKLDIDKFTLEDIIKSLISPERDPRDDIPKPLLRSDILKIEDLHIGDKLQGTVRNVVDFGLFIDIGLHNDGLAHISKLSKEYIKHPADLFSVGDIVDCYVDSISIEKEKVSLTLLEN